MSVIPHPARTRSKGTPQRIPTLRELPAYEMPLDLVCGACKKRGRYRVGTVVVAPEFVKRGPDEPIDAYVGFTGYFRCRRCDAGGPWELTNATRARLLALLCLHAMGDDDLPILIGETRTFDGRSFRYPTESEAHLKELIAAEPERGFLWVRLGNIYKHGGRDDLAEGAFRRAVALAPEDAEAHACLADVLADGGRRKQAVPHWKAVLEHVRAATHLRRELRLAMVSAALEGLLDELKDPSEAFATLAARSRTALEERPKDEPLVLELRNWDLSDPDDWEQVCALFLGERVRPLRQVGPPMRVHPRPERADFAGVPPHEGGAARNAPCPCGSGRKYKKCCGRE